MTGRTLVDDLSWLLGMYGVSGALVSIDAAEDWIEVVAAEFEGPVLLHTYQLEPLAGLTNDDEPTPVYDQLVRDSISVYDRFDRDIIAAYSVPPPICSGCGLPHRQGAALAWD